MTRTFAPTAVTALAAAAGLCLAAAPATAAAPPISGFWSLERSSAPARPALTAWARAEARKTKSRGDVDLDEDRWCVFQGLPYVMDHAGPLDIIQSPTELVIVTERQSLPRHLYTNRKTHPDADVYDNTIVGDTVGHWEGDTFVAETVYLSRGVGPAGIPRTGTSRLAERFHLAGDTLTVASTWTDQKALTAPYAYTLTYRRLPSSYTPVEHYCDPRNNGVGHAAP
jgi:hypothetical protein